jgi:mono/diheme cytochrome c family protein
LLCGGLEQLEAVVVGGAVPLPQRRALTCCANVGAGFGSTQPAAPIDRAGFSPKDGGPCGRAARRIGFGAMEKRTLGAGPGRGLLGAVGLAVAAALISCAGKQTPKDRITDPGQSLFNGQTLSGITCYKCHGDDATGTWRGPNLIKALPTLSDQDIAKTILEGPGLMPSYKGKLDDHQVAKITAWLRMRATTVANAQPR